MGEAATKDESAPSRQSKEFQTRSADEAESRRQRIADAAYYRAMNRGFEPGYELDDWLEAERQLGK